MSPEPSSAPLARIVARRTGEDGGPKLVHQPEVIPVVPDLRDLKIGERVPKRSAMLACPAAPGADASDEDRDAREEEIVPPEADL